MVVYTLGGLESRVIDCVSGQPLTCEPDTCAYEFIYIYICMEDPITGGLHSRGLHFGQESRAADFGSDQPDTFP